MTAMTKSDNCHCYCKLEEEVRLIYAAPEGTTSGAFPKEASIRIRNRNVSQAFLQ